MDEGQRAAIIDQTLIDLENAQIGQVRAEQASEALKFDHNPPPFSDSNLKFLEASTKRGITEVLQEKLRLLRSNDKNDKANCAKSIINLDLAVRSFNNASWQFSTAAQTVGIGERMCFVQAGEEFIAQGEAYFINDLVVAARAGEEAQTLVKKANEIHRENWEDYRAKPVKSDL